MSDRKTELKILVGEAQQYEKERELADQCGKTSVQAVNTIVTNNGVFHAGVISHVCKLKSGHGGDCRCCDSYSWKGGN